MNPHVWKAVLEERLNSSPARFNPGLICMGPEVGRGEEPEPYLRFAASVFRAFKVRERASQANEITIKAVIIIVVPSKSVVRSKIGR